MNSDDQHDLMMILFIFSFHSLSGIKKVILRRKIPLKPKK